MNYFYIILLFILCYILGGIPTGYLVGKSRGIDIRTKGSGNPGTANVYRNLGAKAGLLTFAVDFLKGMIPTLVATHFFFMPGSVDFSRGHWWITVAAGAFTIFGHIWTPFLGFKGGKGVATSAGVFTALLPGPTAFAFAVFGIAVAITSHISVGSILAAISLPIFSVVYCYWYTPATAWHLRPFIILAFCVAVLIVCTHIPNIRRIMSGKELSFRHKK